MKGDICTAVDFLRIFSFSLFFFFQIKQNDVNASKEVGNKMYE